MTVAPSGSISLAESALRTMLSTVGAFQTWCGAADAAAALARIHLDDLPDPANLEGYTLSELQDYRPYAIVFTAELSGYWSQCEGEEGWFSSAGRLMCHLEQDAAAAVGNRPTLDADQTFKNSLGAIVDGLREIRGQTAGHLQFKRIGVAAGPVTAHPDEIPAIGLYQRAVLQIDWGPW